MAALGVDGIITIDDTALQDRLMISIEKFREIFIPRFKKMYQHIHDYGMDTFIHSCGYTLDLIEEFIWISMITWGYRKFPDVIRGAYAFSAH